jgi:hypothetical protein
MKKDNYWDTPCDLCNGWFRGKKGLVVHKTKSHSSQEPLTNTMEWKKRFDEKFSVFDGGQNIIKHVTYSVWIKDFISSELTTARKEEREKTIEEIVSVIKVGDTHPYYNYQRVLGKIQKMRNKLDAISLIRGLK